MTEKIPQLFASTDIDLDIAIEYLTIAMVLIDYVDIQQGAKSLSLTELLGFVSGRVKGIKMLETEMAMGALRKLVALVASLKGFPDSGHVTPAVGRALCRQGILILEHELFVRSQTSIH